MRRPVYRRNTTGMSLFPFLAVLICTMGALIVLLVMVLQQANVHASATQAKAAAARAAAARAAAPAVDPQTVKKLQETKEDLDWRREIFEKQRTDQAEELRKSRLELSHLEDHIRRLQGQWKQLEAQAAQIQQKDGASVDDQAARKAELERLRGAIAAAEKELDEARRKADAQSRSFAILPYDGPNGTKRRPIYIECAEEGITIHPEKVLFLPTDFQGPLGPGNPLDAALRTIREHLARHGDVKRDGEPYPLLVVRPDGAVAYSTARAAMKSWDDEFGYELIDHETKLRFPPADPALEQALMQTIEDARKRQAALAAAMPARYKDDAIGFVASQRGGFTATLPEDDSATSLSGGRTGAGRGANGGSGNGFGGFGTGRNPNASQGFARSAKAGGDNSESSPPAASDGDDRATNATGGRPGGPAGGAAGAKASGTISGLGGQAMAAQPGAPTDGSHPGQSPGQQSGQAGGARTSGKAASSSGSSGASAESLARTRGADWALPAKAANATAVTRPIRIQCFPDRLVIQSERGEQQRPKTFLLRNGSVRGATEEFVSGIWTHMEGWGLAVAGGYWKPLLRVEVAPGAELQFAELEASLRNSGLDVQRR